MHLLLIEDDSEAAKFLAWLLSPEIAPRKERCPHKSDTASSRFVLPCAFSPVMSVTPAPKETGSGERLRKPWLVNSKSCKCSLRRFRGASA